MPVAVLLANVSLTLPLAFSPCLPSSCAFAPSSVQAGRLIERRPRVHLVTVLKCGDYINEPSQSACCIRGCGVRAWLHGFAGRPVNATRLSFSSMNRIFRVLQVPQLTINNGQLTIVDAAYGRADSLDWECLLRGVFHKLDKRLRAMLVGFATSPRHLQKWNNL
jgi:hypothetical protein